MATPADNTDIAPFAGRGVFRNAWKRVSLSAGEMVPALTSTAGSTARSNRRSARTPSRTRVLSATENEEEVIVWPLQAIQCARDSKSISTSSWSGATPTSLAGGLVEASSGSSTLERACTVEEISWGLNAPSRTTHSGANLTRRASTAACFGMTLAQDQRMTDRCCAPSSSDRAARMPARKTSSLRKPSVAKPHSMLEISWALKPWMAGTAA
mmetsp:Transcript_55739/g.165758  ORF Transcript_55739/g.165758 Transcript_55739/m.165758 type:complete len:212 (-) Transcript_55739:879-1514(-)